MEKRKGHGLFVVHTKALFPKNVQNGFYDEYFGDLHIICNFHDFGTLRSEKDKIRKLL